MSAASRHAKADARRHARWVERRERLIAAQAAIGPLTAADVALAFDLDPALFCDGERAARAWCRNHPEPLPHGLGPAYRARRRRSW